MGRVPAASELFVAGLADLAVAVAPASTALPLGVAHRVDDPVALRARGLVARLGQPDHTCGRRRGARIQPSPHLSLSKEGEGSS